MTGAREQMQRIRDERDKEVAEIHDLETRLRDAKIRLELLNKLLGEEADEPRRRNTKKTIMEIVTQADRAGVTPNEVEQIAKASGRTLKLSTIRSTLSKETGHCTLHFDGERYYVAGREPVKVPLQVVGSK